MTTELSRRGFILGGAAIGGSLLLGGGLLSGCHDNSTGSNAPQSTTPRYGGRLRMGIIDGSKTGNLDAHKPTTPGAIIRGFALYSKLWEWSEHMTPDLALAEEVEVNANATLFTIRLRKGLEFHNGKTITADDLIFSTRRLSDPELASPYLGYVKWIDRDNLVKVDERTVQIPIRGGNGLLSLPDAWVNFGGLVPVDYHPVTNPVGAGPYKLKEFSPGQRSVFERFANFYKSGQPYPDELEIIDFKDETARVSALLSGQIDMANGISPEQVEPLRTNKRLQVITNETHGWQSFDLNLSQEPFKDDRVRAAFRLMIDRQEIIDRALAGNGRIANDIYSPLDPTFNHDIPQRQYDPEQARSLLKQAGYDNNLSVEITVGPGLSAVGGGSPAALVFAAQAKKVGVDVKVTQVDAATFGGPNRNDWQISTNSRLGGEFLHTGASVDSFLSSANKTHFSDARFNELFAQASSTTDVEKRRPLVHEAQQIQYDKGGLIIWSFVNTLDVAASNVGGLKPERSHFPTWRFDKLWLNATA
ncbi:MAG: ABC transporter substrate-binding protein [Methylophilaceae bacterium]|nr:ABC transporter substrate-binding protein [Methyloradius sp.]